MPDTMSLAPPSFAPSSLALFQKWAKILLLLGSWSLITLLPCSLRAQDDSSASNPAETEEPLNTELMVPEPLEAPSKVEVNPVAQDQQIAERLSEILDATGWFQNPEVEVEEGVVFLSAETATDEHRAWASQLAKNTQDVVAVVNRIQVKQRPLWDLSPAWAEVHQLTRDIVQSLPLIGLAMAILLITWLVSGLVMRVLRSIISHRVQSKLLSDVIARTVMILFVVLSIYFALRISGLTQVAATVVGSTGLVGLIVGIAFRDIAENFLASILISVQRPFLLGDTVQIDGITGTVQSVTIHGTLLMGMDGNHVQIPNSVVYKSIIQNKTSNPKQRMVMDLGIGYEDSVSSTQEIITNVLSQHPAILKDPSPMVLVDNLGASTVNLRIYAWIDGVQHSLIRVQSAVLRLIKQAVQEAGISMPDEAREIIVPKPIPIQMIDRLRSAPTATAINRNGQTSEQTSTAIPDRVCADESEAVATAAEGDLKSESDELNKQSEDSRVPDSGANLLQTT